MLHLMLGFLLAISIVRPVLAADCVEPTMDMEFDFIEGGTFMIGDPSNKDQYAVPVRGLNFTGFYVGKYEQTCRLFCCKPIRSL